MATDVRVYGARLISPRIFLHHHCGCLIVGLVRRPPKSQTERRWPPSCSPILGWIRQTSQLEAGEVVHNGLSGAERLPDEIVAAGAMLLVKAPEAGGWSMLFYTPRPSCAFFRFAATKLCKEEVLNSLPLTRCRSRDGRLREIVKAPARYLNLSKAETEKLKSLSPTTTIYRAGSARPSRRFCLPGSMPM